MNSVSAELDIFQVILQFLAMTAYRSYFKTWNLCGCAWVPYLTKFQRNFNDGFVAGCWHRCCNSVTSSHMQQQVYLLFALNFFAHVIPVFSRIAFWISPTRFLTREKSARCEPADADVYTFNVQRNVVHNVTRLTWLAAYKCDNCVRKLPKAYANTSQRPDIIYKLHISDCRKLILFPERVKIVFSRGPS